MSVGWSVQLWSQNIFIKRKTKKDCLKYMKHTLLLALVSFPSWNFHSSIFFSLLLSFFTKVHLISLVTLLFCQPFSLFLFHFLQSYSFFYFVRLHLLATHLFSLTLPSSLMHLVIFIPLSEPLHWKPKGISYRTL